MLHKTILFLLISHIAFAQQSMFNANNKKRMNSTATPVEQSIVTGGLILNLDPSSNASYTGSGTTFTDISGAGNHAILSNNPVYTATAPSYFTFSGSNNAHLNFSWTTNFTCSFWIYPLSAPGGGFSRIISTAPGDNLEIAINSNNEISIYTPNIGWQSSTTTLVSNKWSQVVFIKTQTNLSIYVNGSPVFTIASSVSPGTSLYIGQRYNTGEGVNMRFGGILIYNRAFTNTEVTSNWAGQKARFGL